MSRTGSQTFSLSLALAVLAGYLPQAVAEPEFVRGGEAGFVVSHIEFALSHAAEDTGACPNGMSESYQDPREVYANLPVIQKKDGEIYEELEDRVEEVAEKDPDVKSLCLHPEMGSPDPEFRVVTGENVPVHGFDRDGQDSPQDFVSMDGEAGVDNQFFRVIGCTKGYQPSGQGNGFAIGMLTGSWGLVITLSGVDDINNDDEVTVGVYANNDPIRLSPDRNPLAYATYTSNPDSRYHAETRGRISDGVLTTEPMDVRYPSDVNGMYLENVLRDAQLHMTLSEDGVLKGYIGGYAPVEELYNANFGFRDATGEFATLRRRSASSIGKAGALGYTCEGIYHALYEHADGHPDPETGENTSISLQYRIEAIPAFVVDAAEQRAAAEQSKGASQ